MSLRETDAIHRELGDLTTAAAHCALHRSQQAIEFGRRAVKAGERTRDLEQQARALTALGDAQHACGDVVDAIGQVGKYVLRGAMVALSRVQRRRG